MGGTQGSSSVWSPFLESNVFIVKFVLRFVTPFGDEPSGIRGTVWYLKGETHWAAGSFWEEEAWPMEVVLAEVAGLVKPVGGGKVFQNE